MERSNKQKRRRPKASEAELPPNGTAQWTPHAFLIRLPDREAMKRAIIELGEVRTPYCAFRDWQLLVVQDHIDLLRRLEIPFEEVS